MKYKRKIGFLFILTVLIIKSACGQSKTLFQDNYTKFYSYTTNQGLSCSDVLDVIQDKYGFIWVATKNGLNKFNGQVFTQYFAQQNNSHSLCDNLITSLAEDIYGTVWVGTKSGLCKYNRSKNCFEKIIAQPMLSDSNIRALYADSKGNLWIETMKGGLNCVNISTGNLTNFPHRPLVFEGDYFYHFIFEDSKQRIWIGGRNFHPRYLDSNKKVFVPGESFNGNDGSCIFEDYNQIIWTSGNYGFNYYNENTEMMDDSSGFQVSFRVHSTLNEGNGLVWFGGDGDKVLSYDQNKKKWTSLEHNDMNPFSIISTKINRIYKDKEGNIWFATSAGLSVKPKEINKFRHFRYIPGVTESLTSNKITALIEDKKGVLWVGSQDCGVDTSSLEAERFGNLRYEILNKKINRKTFEREKDVLKDYAKSKIVSTADIKLLDKFEDFSRADLEFKISNENYVSALYEDSKGTIYIGLWNGAGFNSFNYKIGFKRYYLYVEPGSTLFSNELLGANWYNDFLEDSQNNFWIATWEGIGLNLFNRDKCEFQGFNASGENYPFDKLIYNFVNQNDSLLWFNNLNIHIGYVNLLTGRVRTFVPDEIEKNNQFKKARKYLPFSGFTAINMPLTKTGLKIVTDDNQNVWIISGTSLISKYNTNDGKFVNYRLKFDEEEVLKAVFSDDEKKIFLLTSSGRILSFSVLHFITEEISIFQNEGQSEISNIACFDRNLWIATKDGLFEYSIVNKKVNPVELSNFRNNKLPKINTMNISGDCLYLSSDNEIFKYCKDSHRIENLSRKINFYPVISQFSQFLADGNFLWAGSDNGLFKIDFKTGLVVEYKYDQFNGRSLPDNEITALSLINDELFIATRKGLCKISKQTNEIILLNQIPETCLSTRLLTRLKEDNEGYIWIGTSEKGVSRLNQKTMLFEHFFEIPGDTSTISGNYVESVFQDSKGNIWVGTEKALNKFNRSSKTFTHYQFLEKYNSGPVKAIQEDSTGNLWISTTNGLIRFNTVFSEFIHISNSNGIQDNTFSNAATKLTDGRLAFGGPNGITVFNPEDITPGKEFPEIIIENVTINDSLYFVDFSEIDTLLLNYSQNNISFLLGTSEYFASELITFKYRLKGFEEIWNSATVKNNQIKYNNLRPGKYCMEISSDDAYGRWSKDFRTCYIEIKSPWWTTWWFLSLTVFVFGGLIVFVIRLRERNLKDEKKRLEKMVGERTSELSASVERLKQSESALAEAVAAKDKFFSIVAHDLKNPVVALQLISDKLVTDFTRLTPHQQAELLATMNRQIHQTHSFLDNLLLWSLTQRNAIPFRPVTVYVDSLITEVLDLLQENARLKKIKLVKSVPDGLCAFADRNMVFTILNNLVNNALKFSFPDNQINITAWEDETLVKISVKDFGTGIPQEQLPKLFNITSKYRIDGTSKESGTGIGLLLSKEFAEKNGGKIFVESFENQGTNFYFTLPKTMSQ